MSTSSTHLKASIGLFILLGLGLQGAVRAESGKLLLTGGVSTVEGAAGGGEVRPRRLG